MVMVMEGVVDSRGRPISRSSSGRWTSALFIIGVEIAERSAYVGISSNLITYLTGPLGEPTASAAAAVNAWSGASCMLPLVGALVADSYLGRYRTIAVASLLYLMGLALLTFSSMLPTLYPNQQCHGLTDLPSCPPTRLQLAVFYSSLYLVALAQGCHKPCVQAFGADQFDETDPDECRAKSSFFNWWYFGMCGGAAVATFVLSYVEDNISWCLGFGIPCALVAIALAVFLLGSRTYRCYTLQHPNPFSEISRQCWSWLLRHGRNILAYDEAKVEITEGLVQSRTDDDDDEEQEANRLFQLLPVWAACSLYAVVLAQPNTFFTKQASTLDRRIGSSFQLPAATLQCLIGLTIVSFVPVYDRLLVPLARKFTNRSSGITMLQRIGTGLGLSVLPIVTAALVERKRLQTARDHGLLDRPDVVVPMSLWWLVPQYAMFGVTNVFTMVGLQELFYDQVPDGLRSLGIAMYLSIFGVGDFTSGFLISVIDRVTAERGESWFANNLNRAHLDYFYWLLAGMVVAEFAVYLYVARSYVYKKKARSIHV